MYHPICRAGTQARKQRTHWRYSALLPDKALEHHRLLCTPRAGVRDARQPVPASLPATCLKVFCLAVGDLNDYRGRDAAPGPACP